MAPQPLDDEDIGKASRKQIEAPAAPSRNSQRPQFKGLNPTALTQQP
jgi:hypothetical protein